MSSLLSSPCSSVCGGYVHRSRASFSALMHTSSCLRKQAVAHRKPKTSRTKLAQDLKSNTKPELYDSGPSFKTAGSSSFTRDPVPHTGLPQTDNQSSQKRQLRQPRPPRRLSEEMRSRGWDVDGGRQVPSYKALRSASRFKEDRSRNGRDDASRSDARRHDADRPVVSISDRGRRSPSLRIANHLTKIQPPAPSLPALDGDFPQTFISPPLMPGLQWCLKQVLGTGAVPTAIQSLSLKHLFKKPKVHRWKQYLLASETGSGKSIAYLMPVLQALKESEGNPTPATSVETTRPRSPTDETSSVSDTSSTPEIAPVADTSSVATTPAAPQYSLNPRALILAPTHELSRQLTGFAKSLIHEIKLRILCASRANTRSTLKPSLSSSQMAQEMHKATDGEGAELHLAAAQGTHPVDMIVGTPTKLLEMARGRGWSRQIDDAPLPGDKDYNHRRQQVGTPEMGLANVEWVVVDEADVLLDPDFQETTRTLLADISAARGHPVPVIVEPIAAGEDVSKATATPLNYPFNFLLTSATIPFALSAYLEKFHPELTRLVSPNLHQLPKSLQTEYVSWSGGNKSADIERRLRRVWSEDSTSGKMQGKLSKVIIFCNKNTKVVELGEYLTEKGIQNVALTSESSARKHGSNHHLDGFLRPPVKKVPEPTSPSSSSDPAPSPTPEAAVTPMTPADAPHVMITTSLLSRGLDFAPDIRHVFIVDEPRNLIDFLHRAGRSGRAGAHGKVVIFGKMKGRGSAQAKDVRKRVATLSS
ncbi:hypothetical protein HGRIS_014398 [Hohenbuehelia grisea]|uniref:RNA helicase n=1 Tax=Hohenbuehelia grisea TaxID=104357 RepID=A0ABR3JUQ8_9AGAR